ncbi:MAG: hypothetical protein SCARUB_05100 [Candidatus Scalindua rubra]|uniref:Uncharacterized protein n=1 Tax=Candidatus Scalindua rubra TaxID=1872076 RepID=A0A1E3X2K3_9BACT|nr:MAG: hypothetical protein SCARUB_05100 [Candidatus Scalindua rubra]
MIQKNSCPNFNHGRVNAPVRFCPTCGGVVNENIPIKSWCSEEEHAIKRRERSKYCIDCGKQLIQETEHANMLLM